MKELKIRSVLEAEEGHGKVVLSCGIRDYEWGYAVLTLKEVRKLRRWLGKWLEEQGEEQ